MSSVSSHEDEAPIKCNRGDHEVKVGSGLSPSLHLSLTTILWVKYSAHLSGIPLWLMRVWLALAGIATLTTYQHHFIDLPTGVLVGLIELPLKIGRKRTVRCGLRSRHGALLKMFSVFPSCELAATRCGGLEAEVGGA